MGNIIKILFIYYFIKKWPRIAPISCAVQVIKLLFSVILGLFLLILGIFG